MLVFLQHLREFGLVYQRKVSGRSGRGARSEGGRGVTVVRSAAQGRPLLPHAAGAEHRVARRGGAALGAGAGAGAGRLRRGGDQLPRVRLHADQPAGGPAGAVLRAHVQVPQPGGGRGDARVGAPGAARGHHGAADRALPGAALAPAGPAFCLFLSWY